MTGQVDFSDKHFIIVKVQIHFFSISIDPVAEQLLLEISPNLRSIISNNLLHEFFEMDYPYNQKI